MAKDPAFLFYPGDASNDTQFMNRLERGAYFDLVKSQRIFHGYTVVQLRKILGNDFDAVWPSLELVLSRAGEEYFIGWLRESIDKRDEFSKKQSERIKGRWNNRGNTAVLPKKENEIENEIESKDETEFEKVIVEEVGVDPPPKKQSPVFTPPTDHDVATEFNSRTDNKYIATDLPNRFAQVFIAHYTNTDWRYGKAKTKMKSWRAAMTSSWNIDEFIQKHSTQKSNGNTTMGEKYPGATEFARQSGIGSIFDKKSY